MLKKLLIALGVVALIPVVLGVAVIAWALATSEPKTEAQRRTLEEMTKKPVLKEPYPGVGDWKVSRKTDSFEGIRKIFLNNDKPSIGLSVQCQSDSPTPRLYLVADQPLEAVYDDDGDAWVEARTRLDEAEPVSRRWQLEEESLKLVFPCMRSGSCRLLDEILAHDTIAIRMFAYSGNTLTETFDVTGLDEAIANEEICSQRPSP